MRNATELPDVSALQASLEETTRQLMAARAEVERVSAERDRLREAYQRATLELELLKRRIFVAKAERVDTAQLELSADPRTGPRRSPPTPCPRVALSYASHRVPVQAPLARGRAASLPGGGRFVGASG